MHNSNVERLRKHQIVLMTCSIKVPKKFAKQRNSNNGNTKILTSLNRLKNLRLQDDSTNTSFQNNRTDNPSFISNPVLVHESV